ncbi:MAG: choice-of-anchor D domain-containing protein, partial [Candidatus Caldarchaeum sp.]
DEPEDDAEPAIQATACGQATGEAVPAGARMHAQMYDAGEGGDLIGSSYDVSEGNDYGPQICTSQWGYDYLCLSRTPAISLSTTTLTLPQTFITQQTQASFVIWNSGGGTLTGTVSVPAPFSIVSGSSFSLLPGQPQEVVVRFSSTTPGSFSKSLSISSNGGSKTVTATAVAHKISFSPATLDFGSGLLVLREQCNKMGTCGLGTEKVGLPIEKALTIKNEGTVAVTLTLSTAAPYKIVSVLPTLSPGQSGQVTVRFDPSESGSFTGTVQVGIQDGQGSVSSSPLVGVAHKIEIGPPELGFGLLLLDDSPEDNYKEQQLVIKNQGVTTLSLALGTSAPFTVVTGNSFGLAPSESYEVTVRFTPPAPGEFQGSVRLAVGQLVIEVPAKASAMNKQDFLQMLAKLSQIQEVDAVIPGRLVDVALLGFKDLTEGDVQAFWELAKTGAWGYLEPDQTGIWWVDLLIGYLVGLAIDMLRGSEWSINISNVMFAVGQLASMSPDAFLTQYQGLLSGANPDFRSFVDAIINMLNRLGPDGLTAAFGTTNTSDIVRDMIIKRVVDLYRNEALRENITIIITWFGPVGAFFLATMDMLGPNTYSLTITSLRAILDEFATYPWFSRGSQLWEQLAQALATLGMRALSNKPSVENQFKETLMALVITADMARDGGWEIYAFRRKITVRVDLLFSWSTFVDVVAATTLSTGRRVNVFAQFFHAVTGFNYDKLEKLIWFVIDYAQNKFVGGRVRVLKQFGLDESSAQRIADYKPGIVVAVNDKVDTNNNGKTDRNEATDLITTKVNSCNGCFFGVVIVIDPDEEKVKEIIGIGISPKEAEEIANRMGIYIGDQWSVDQLIGWLMGYFMK